MFITPSFKKSLIVEQFQGNYLKAEAYHLEAYNSVHCWGFSVNQSNFTS